MAGVKISNLPAITTPAYTDVYPVVQSGTTYKVTGTQLGTLFVSLTGATMTGLLTLSGNPTATLHAATKGYVDSAVAGVGVLDPVRLGTTTNLTATYDNGVAGVGATLTNSAALAALSIDGTAASLNDRILVKDQSTQTQNGIYTVTVVGDGATAWVLTRATDYDEPTDIDQGGRAFITAGSTNQYSSWIQTQSITTIGTDNIAFQQFSEDLATIIKGIQDNQWTYAADSGAADAYVVTLSEVPSAYTAGMIVFMNVANDNTGASTINVNSLGVKNIKLEDGTDPSQKDLIAGQIAMLIYDGTNFQLKNPAKVLGVTTVVTGTSDNLEANRVFVSNNAGLVTLTLPATAKVGDVFSVQGYGAGGWSVAQNAGQTIHSSAGSTTTGAGGSISSSAQNDSLEFRCVVANTDFVVQSMNGALTFV